jgi:hypothetical protein
VGKVGKWALAVALCVGCAKGPEHVSGNVVPDGGGVVTQPPPPPPPDDAGPPDSGTPPDAGEPLPNFGAGLWPVANLEFGFKDGILETPVVAMSSDEAQNLWVATHFALYLLRPGETKFHRYDTGNSNLHLQGNAIEYCADRFFADGDKSCRFGEASNVGITTIVGGRANEVFVGYDGAHDWNDPHDGDWFSVNRHSGKVDRVKVKDDDTLDVVRFDLVSGNSPQFWHNRIVYRMVYDHFIHRHELYVGTEHGIDKLSPDKWFEPRKDWPFVDNLHWMSDHLHPVACLGEQCTGDEGKDDQRMGEWRGLALSPEGDLWVGGKWSAGKIFYTEANAGVKPDGSPDPEGNTGWFQRGGKAFTDPVTGRGYAFGFDFCGTSGTRKVWQNGAGWVQTSCSPQSGTPPIFWPPNPGDPVGITAVTVTPDGTTWWASGPFGGNPAYGIASYDGHRFSYFDPAQIGMAESMVMDMVALPDGRLVVAGPNSGLTFWDPKTGKHTSMRAGQGIPGDQVLQMELDTMLDPPALHLATSGGAAMIRVMP